MRTNGIVFRCDSRRSSIWPLAALFGRRRGRAAASGRTHRRSGRQGRRVGADVSGDGREDARPGQGHAAGLRGRSRVGRRPDDHRRREAGRSGARRRVQRRPRGVLAPPRARGGRRRQGDVRSGRHVRGRYFEGDGSCALSAARESRAPARQVPRVAAGHAHRAQYARAFLAGSRTPARCSWRCASWCTALLHIVPARVAGVWQLPSGELMLNQQFQMVSGTLSGSGATPISDGRLLGDQITFKVAGDEYTGRVTGDRIEGTVSSGGNQRGWSATRRR